jgi:hypothetical protein
MIWAKKRFEILKRDWFRCKYCWKNWRDVSLEVDHILPKSKWWKDTMENLITCCRECNIWKWSDIIEKPAKNLYKQKIDDCVYKIKSHFYWEWNKSFLWSIDKETATLLVMYINHHIKDDNVYCTRLNYPPLYWDDEDWCNIDHKKMDIIFKQWWSFCDAVLNVMYNETIDQYIDILIEEIIDNSWWLPKNNNSPWRFASRLNYKLTQYLWEVYGDKKYIISRFTLYPNLLEDE